MKAQQGLKCDDLFKKSVLMNEVNKLLCKYKLDECIVFQPQIDAYSVSIYFPLETDDTTEYSFYKNGVLVSSSYTNEDIVNYFLNLGFGSIGQVPFINPNFIDTPTGWEAGDYNVNTQNLYTTNTNLYYPLSDTYSTPIAPEFFNPLDSEIVANAYAIGGNTEDEYSIFQNSTEAEGSIFFFKFIIVEETCVEYTEEELNCITPQDLQLLFEFTHKYKETLAKSTKRITSPSTSSSSPSPSDCCNWGSIGGSIGNQSDLVAYLNTIKKNFIAASNESVLISNDIKSLNFLGAGVTATNSGGDINITIPGGGGGAAFWGDIGGIITEQGDLITYLEDNYYPLNSNPAGYLTENSLMIEVTNAELITLLGSNSITKGVIYRVMDAIDGIVQVVGRGSNSVNRAAYREGRSDNTLLQFMGIFGNYTPSTNTFLEQGRIATEPTVNEDFVHGYYVGQELKTLDTGLTYVCTDNTNTSAVWTLVPSGGSQDLSQVLAVGNTSGANDIQFDTLQGLLFNNSSRVREGITDAGLGGAKGVALVCSLDYELKWEAGRLYVMDQTGSFIRQSLYNFNIAPTATDDFNLGYMTGSLWTLDDGTVYVCTDAGTLGGDAVWTLSYTNAPDLQQVTDAGFTTTNKILSDDAAGNYTEIGNGEIKIGTGNTGEVIIDSSLVTAAYNAQLPDKPTSPQTFAMLSDITGGSLDLEVNGTPNVDQTLLNLIEGVNIDIADNGTGGVTITSLSDRYATTSVTSNIISNGAKTFIVDANLAYIPLQEVLIVNDPARHMHGEVTAYNSTTGQLDVDVKSHTGSALSYSSWVINLDGTPVDAITGVGTANEIAYFTGGQVIASLAAGANGQVLGLSGGLPTWSTSKGAFGVTFDGQGGVVSVGKTDWVFIPYNCTITGWVITGDQVGSCVIDIWKDTYANFPPTAADSIAGSEKPTLASARTNIDLSLSPPWAAVTAGDCIMFYVESCSTLTKINLIVYTNIII